MSKQSFCDKAELKKETHGVFRVSGGEKVTMEIQHCPHMHANHNTHSCTARAIDNAVEPVSLTLSKVTFGRSSSSLSLLICLGDRPLGSVCAMRTGHRNGSQTHDTGTGNGNVYGISHCVCWKVFNCNEVVTVTAYCI